MLFDPLQGGFERNCLHQLRRMQPAEAFCLFADPRGAQSRRSGRMPLFLHPSASIGGMELRLKPHPAHSETAGINKLGFCPRNMLAKGCEVAAERSGARTRGVQRSRHRCCASRAPRRRSMHRLPTSIRYSQQQSYDLPLRACQPSRTTNGMRHRAATGSAHVIPQKAFATRPARAMIDR
jgi:hypothetical protein